MFFPRSTSRKFYAYLLKEFFSIFLLSLGILTFILVISRIGKLTDLVVNKGVGIKDIILLIFYSSPPYLNFTLPMAVLLSTIVVLGRFSTENEILALKASGVDLKSLFYPIIATGLIIAMAGIFNSMIILPKSSELFRSTLLTIVKKGISIDDKEGVFNDAIPGIVIYIDKVDTTDKMLLGIVVSDDRDKENRQMISASRGYINLDPVTLDLNFVLENGNLHRWEKSSDEYRNLAFANYVFSMNLASMLPNLTALRKRPYEMDIRELKKKMTYYDTYSDKYNLMIEIYKKASIPLSTLAFVFLAIPLGIRRRVEGRFSGILYSLLLFIFYYLLMALSENFGRTVYLHPAAATFIPNAVIAAMGLYMFKNLNMEDHATVSKKIKYLWGYYLEKAK